VADAELCEGRAVSLKTAKGKGEEILRKIIAPGIRCCS